MISKVYEDPSKPIRRIYNECVVAANDIRPGDLPQFDNVRSKLSRERQSLIPEIPNEIEDVDIVGEYSRTWDGDSFLSRIDNDWGIAVFATEKNIKRLQRCSIIYIDGTFKTCPHPYAQFVTVHGMYYGRVLPFAMALLGGKTVGHYRQLLQHLKTKCREVTRHRFNPRQVITDFEVALVTALETELPNTRRSGCYFHYCKNLWRRIQHLGLVEPYLHHLRVQKCLQKYMAIAFLPLALVRPNFQLLSHSHSTARVIRRYPQVQQFIDYLDRNYMNGEFPPEMWNVYARDGDTRSNNHVEGEHFIKYYSIAPPSGIHTHQKVEFILIDFWHRRPCST